MKAKALAAVATATVVATLGATALSLRAPSVAVPVNQNFTLTEVTIVNPGRARFEHGSIVVAGDRITVAGPRDGMQQTTTALSEFKGRYILPGLIDLHAHLPPKSLLDLSVHAGLMLAAHGVTTVRVVGDTDGSAVPAMQEAIAAGAVGPRIFNCGPFVVGKIPSRWPNSVVVERADGADQVVRQLRDQGMNCIKIYEDLDPPRLMALREAAHRYGLRMIGHLSHGIDYTAGLVDEVQHFHGVPPPASMARDHIMDRAIHWDQVSDARLGDVVEATLRNGTANTPTLSSTAALLRYRDYPATIVADDLRDMPRLYREVAWSPKSGIPFWRGIERRIPEIDQALANKRKLVRMLYDAGATLLVGTDIQQPFVIPGLSVHHEMAEFVAAGIPLEQVWAIATAGAGQALGQPLLGQLLAGAPADFLIFREDPTTSLANLDTLEAVVINGRLHRAEDLQQARTAWRAHFEDPIFDAVSMRAGRRMLAKNVLRDY